MASRRIKRELELIKQNPISFLHLEQDNQDNNPLHFTGYILGPLNSPYENYVYTVMIHCNQGYPFKPPRVRMLTGQFYHCGIDSNGGFAYFPLLDYWCPMFQIQDILIGIYDILENPNTDEIASSNIAHLYKYNRQEYNKNVKIFAKTYAISNNKCHFNLNYNSLQDIKDKKIKYVHQLDIWYQGTHKFFMVLFVDKSKKDIINVNDHNAMLISGYSRIYFKNVFVPKSIQLLLAAFITNSTILSFQQISYIKSVLDNHCPYYFKQRDLDFKTLNKIGLKNRISNQLLIIETKGTTTDIDNYNDIQINRMEFYMNNHSERLWEPFKHCGNISTFCGIGKMSERNLYGGSLFQQYINNPPQLQNNNALYFGKSRSYSAFQHSVSKIESFSWM